MVWFGLNPHKALHYHLFFWLAALLPPLLGSAISISVMHTLDFSWSYKGLTFWVDNNKLPIGIMALGIPFGVMVGSFHRTLQTAEQIRATESTNNFKNYTEHKKDFIGSMIDSVEEVDGNKIISENIYRYFFPDSEPHQSALSAFKIRDLNEDIAVLDEAINFFRVNTYISFTEDPDKWIDEGLRFLSEDALDEDTAHVSCYFEYMRTFPGFYFLGKRYEAFIKVANFLEVFCLSIGVGATRIRGNREYFMRTYELFRKSYELAVVSSIDDSMCAGFSDCSFFVFKKSGHGRNSGSVYDARKPFLRVLANDEILSLSSGMVDLIEGLDLYLNRSGMIHDLSVDKGVKDILRYGFILENRLIEKIKSYRVDD